MRRYIFIIILSGLTLAGFAQDDISGKLSVTTQIFLNEMNEKININPDTKSEQENPKHKDLHPVHPRKQRLIASPDTIDGKVYISAFIRLNDNTNVSELEGKGVQVQEKFAKGLITALIPIDKIEEVASIANVRRVNVASQMQCFTNNARQKTNVDDVLTHSADAISSGLQKKYDGSGVILGIIDNGIDFQHIAFKDKNGNSRIKRAYVYNGSSAKEYTTISSNSPTTDNSSEDHGTHTSSTAGGSSVIVNGNTVTVTDDHANATYGGMAPGADLYLAGIKGLGDTYLANAVNKMVTYADQQGKPLVVSNSWGSQLGPHDGTGDVADIYNSLFGDSHPNRIALFAASNESGKSKDGEGGGYHVRGTATRSNPLGAILRSAVYIDADGGDFYQGIIANAWARSSSVTKLAVKIIVLDANTGEEKTSVTMTSAGIVSGLSNYYSGTLTVYYDYVQSEKTQVFLYSRDGIETKSETKTTQDGSTYYKSNYTLAIQVYPYSGASSSVVDLWGGSEGYFTNHLTTDGYIWTAGSDDMSVSDEATIENVISVGAYVSSKKWTNYNGTSYIAPNYTLYDIADFSSYATAAESPTGLQYPWITAPGARLISGVNHYHKASVDDYSYYGSSFNKDLIVNSSQNPYAEMEGTSMATPTAAGIVALWMQASLEENAVKKNLTVNDVKNIMKETAIHDSYTTTGPNASHFGNGKIDALAGIQYILGVTGGPTINAEPTTVEFASTIVGQSTTKTVSVTGVNLEGNVAVALSGNDAAMFSIDKENIEKATAEAGTPITITYTPTAAGSHKATLTLSSTNATDVTITINAKAEVPQLLIVEPDPEVLTFQTEAGTPVTQEFSFLAANLTDQVTATISGNDASLFGLSKSTFTKAEAEEGQYVTVTYTPQSEGTHSATVTLSSPGAEDVTVALNGTATRKLDDFTVSIGNYGLTTLYLDYPVVIPYDNPDLLGVYYVYQINESEAKLARLKKHIPANEGVIVQGNSGNITFSPYRGPAEELETIKYPLDNPTNVLTGSTTNISPSDVLANAPEGAIIMTLGKKSKDGTNGYVGFYHFTGNTLSANKAFIIYTKPSQSNIMSLSLSGIIGETFTGIQEVKSENANEGWYTMQGVKLNTTPKQRGIYIHNGKTVVVK